MTTKKNDESMENAIVESDEARQLMADFCHGVSKLGANVTGLCGIDSPRWEVSLSQGYGFENYDSANEIIANMLDALCVQNGWGPDELFEFVEAAMYRVSESMQMRMPRFDLPPS